MVATKEIMKKFQKNLMKGKKKFNLHDMTPEYIVDTIIDTAATEEIPAESMAGLRSEMLKLFVRPGAPVHDK